MPVYTYRCENCGVQFDRHQKFSDAPLSWCPECGKKALRKVYTPVGIVFKGSGFYSTDHRSPSGSTRPSSSEDKNMTVDKSGAEKPAKSEPQGSKPAESKSDTSSSTSSASSTKE